MSILITIGIVLSIIGLLLSLVGIGFAIADGFRMGVFKKPGLKKIFK